MTDVYVTAHEDCTVTVTSNGPHKTEETQPGVETKHNFEPVMPGSQKNKIPHHQDSDPTALVRTTSNPHPLSVVPRSLSNEYKRPKFVQYGDSDDGSACWVRLCCPGLKKGSCWEWFHNRRSQQVTVDFQEQAFLVKVEIHSGTKEKPKLTKYCCRISSLPGPIDTHESTWKIIKNNILELTLKKAEPASGQKLSNWKHILEDRGLDDPEFDDN